MERLGGARVMRRVLGRARRGAALTVLLFEKPKLATPGAAQQTEAEPADQDAHPDCDKLDA